MYIYMVIQGVQTIERSLLPYTIVGSIFQWFVETYNSTIPPCLCLLLGKSIFSLKSLSY